MKNLIQAIDGWRTKTAAQIAAILNTASVTKTDDQLYTWAGIAENLGPQDTDLFRQALQNNGMSWAIYQLGGKGLQLSHPLTQAALTGLAAANVAGAQLLKNLGVFSVSPWVNAGNFGTVSESQVQAALLAIQKEEMIDAARDIFEQYRVAVVAWNGSGDPPVMGG